MTKTIYVYKGTNAHKIAGFLVEADLDNDTFRNRVDYSELFSRLKESAEHTKKLITNYRNLKSSSDEVIRIIFQPRQDILFRRGFVLCRCKKLSGKEENEFWKYFSGMADKEVRDG